MQKFVIDILSNNNRKKVSRQYISLYSNLIIDQLKYNKTNIFYFILSNFKFFGKLKKKKNKTLKNEFF